MTVLALGLPLVSCAVGFVLQDAALHGRDPQETLKALLEALREASPGPGA